MKKLSSLFIALSLAAVFIFDVPAQTRSRFKEKRFSSQNKRRKKQKSAIVPQTAVITQKTDSSSVVPAAVPQSSPLTVQNVSGNVTVPQSTQEEISGDVQSGNVVVNVSSNGNAVVKIGLSARGVSVIDFPANDPVYKIHPGDENFVTVDCQARTENGRCGNSPTDAIVLRPGKNFHSLDTEESAATVITVQRVSGIVVSFIVVPVKTIAQNANYVVVRYSLQDVIEARMNAGLAVNLAPGMIALPKNDNKIELQNQPDQNNPQYLQINAKNDNPENQNAAQTEDERLQAAVVAELERVAQNSSAFKFSKPVYGLSLARASIGSRTGEITIDVIAVRNTLPQAIRLVPDQPELVVENREKRDSSINIQRFNVLHTATTVEADDVLEPGQIYYFAFAYSSPILGVKQVLRVSFAQREAADAPATMELGSFAR